MSAFVFVGHWYIQKYIDDYRHSLKEVFESLSESPELKYADSNVITEQILQFGIQPMINNSLFCIFDISNEHRPNIALEMGYAFGRGKYVVITSETLPKDFSDLAGFAIVTYNSFKELREKLIYHLPEYMSKAKEHNENAKFISAGEFILDNPKTKQLLELHRASLTDWFLPFAINYLRGMSQDKKFYNYDYLFGSIEKRIVESRSLLEGFSHHKVGDIKKFIERNFEPDELAEIIRKEIVPILKSKKPDEVKKLKKLETKIRRVEENVFEKFYRELDDSEKAVPRKPPELNP